MTHAQFVTTIQLVAIAFGALVAAGLLWRPVWRVWRIAYALNLQHWGRWGVAIFVLLTLVAIPIGIALGLGLFGVALGPGFWWWIW